MDLEIPQGKLYLEKYESPDLKRSGDCFYLAGSYEVAARVYAKGRFFSDCLIACEKGGLFETGLEYIQHWKQTETAGHELCKIEQQFLESCARKYFDSKDTRSMMKFVRAFHSMDLKHEFLRSLSLLDELLMLEEESGNFIEAVNIARLTGDTLREADLLGKAGKFMEAFELIILYVLANSLWSSGGKGWPLKPFAQKGELVTRALSFAKQESSRFYVFACTEAEILSNENSDVVGIMDHLKSSRVHGSIRGEILSLWKLLDAHFQLNFSKYVWKDNVIVDSVEGMILNNQLSVETLSYCWICWRDNIVHIFEDLPNLESQDAQQLSIYGQFALNYLGVQKQIANLNDSCHLLVPAANWVTKMGDGFLKRNGRVVSADVHFLVSAAQSYWQSELLSAGMKVLQNLDALYKFPVNKVISSQVRTLMLIYEVSKFFIESKYFSHSCGNLKALEESIRLPLDCFFSYLVPLDWKKSLTKNMVSLRSTEACQDLVKRIICENIRGKDKLTFRQIGRVVTMIFGTANPKGELCVEIMKRFDDNLPWRVFIQCLHQDSAFKEMNSVVKFYEALKETCKANWIKKADSISPSCFIYLIERLVIMTSRWQGLIFASKSSFIEWLIYHDRNDSLVCWSWIYDNPEEIENIQKFILHVLRQVLCNPNDTINWITKSETNGKDYFPLFVLRSVASICLLHLSSGSWNCLKLLNELLNMSQITRQLPLEFRNVLQKGRKCLDLKVMAEAFKKVDNPLVIVLLRNKYKKMFCPDAVFLDLKMCQHREHVLQVLFANGVDTVPGETGPVTVEASDSTSKLHPSTNCFSLPTTSSAPVADQTLNSGLKYEMNVNCFWNMLENLQLAIDAPNIDRVLNNSRMVKDFLDRFILISSNSGSLPQDSVQVEDRNEMGEVESLLNEMKQLSAVLSVSDSVIDNHIPVISEFSKQILLRRSKVEHILEQLFLFHKKTTIVDYEPLEASTASGNEDGQNDLEKSKDNMSKNSHGAINSGHGNIKENTKGKKTKSNKNKGGKKKGRK